mgnify:CR=1 FL=1
MTAASAQRAGELRQLLNAAAHAYYVLDAPVMEDPVYGPFEALERLQNGLRDHGWDVQEWEHCWHPLTNVTINDPETARQCLKLLDVLDELDDVSSVSANLELAPDLNL